MGQNLIFSMIFLVYEITNFALLKKDLLLNLNKFLLTFNYTIVSYLYSLIIL